MEVLQEIDLGLFIVRAVSPVWASLGIQAYLDHAQFALRQIDKLDLLHGNSLTSAPVKRFEHGTEGSFSQAFP
jgi:hypothetical protein